MTAPLEAAPLRRIAPALRDAFTAHRYDPDGLLALLGEPAYAALGRGEPVPVRRACRDGGELGVLARLFLLHDTLSARATAAALGPLPVADAVAAGLLAEDGDGLRAALDVRPLDAGFGTRWVFADIDGSMREVSVGPDHVLGVGRASLSLLRATPTAPVGHLLDLGTGCGVQAVHAAGYASHITATDISGRAAVLAAASFAINGIDVDLRVGPWFDPVAGRKFDQIVANPPFVVGSGTVDHSYRDSGLDLDGASALMFRESVRHLAPGGTAVMLASWVHRAGQPWQQRVSGWLPDEGVDAWVVQRDVSDPALYVGTWLRDAGVPPRSERGAARSEQWLGHFEREGVEGVGFGYVFLRRTEGPSDVLAEDLRHDFDDPLGPEALAYLRRVDWLRGHDLLSARLAVDPTTTLEEVCAATGEGWAPVAARLCRGGGPAWQHEVDERTAMLLAGLQADGLPLRDVLELVAAACGDPAEEIVEAGARLVEGLVRHGLVVPADLVGPGQGGAGQGGAG